MKKDKAEKLLAARIEEFNEALRKAQEIADENGLTFHIYPSYGMGGIYEGKGYCDDDGEEGRAREEGIWLASSNSC